MSSNISDNSSTDDVYDPKDGKQDPNLTLRRDPSVLEDLARVLVNQDLENDHEIDAFDNFDIDISVENAVNTFLTLNKMKGLIKEKVDKVKTKKDNYL